MVSRPQGKEIDIKLKFVPATPDKSEQTEVYANVIQVSQTPWDFVLTFCLASMPEEDEVKKSKNKGEIVVHVPRVATVRVSPRMAKEIVKVLQEQTKKYDENIKRVGE